MALVKFGMMMTDASGKLGGQVFSKNKGGSYVRTKVTPTNPQTPFQSSVRATFGTLSAAWGELTDAQRQSWVGAVDSFKRTNVFGDLKSPTGKALFQRLNQNLVQSGQAQITDAPTVESPVALTAVAAVFNVTGSTLTITATGDASGNQVQLWASPPLTPGTHFFKNRIRAVSYKAGSAAVSADITSDYVARFGAIVSGDNIYAGLRTISSTGQASPLAIVKVTFTP